MNLRKFFRRTATVLAIAACSLFAEAVEAGIQIYEGVGVYAIEAGETQDVAKKRAKRNAERDALEQIYFYIKSHSLSHNSRLLKDEIITIAAGEMNVLKTTFDVEKNADSFVVTATVTVEIDPEKIPEAVEREKKKRLAD